MAEPYAKGTPPGGSLNYRIARYSIASDGEYEDFIGSGFGQQQPCAVGAKSDIVCASASRWKWYGRYPVEGSNCVHAEASDIGSRAILVQHIHEVAGKGDAIGKDSA